MTDNKSNNPFKNEELEDIKEVQPQEDNASQDAVDSNLDNSELDNLKQDYEKLNTQYMRLAADFENYRKRQENERESLLRFGTENALTKMIEILDNFERAEKSLENVEECQKYKDSLAMLHKQVYETLTKMGMEPINATGQEFNPNFHDAIMQTPTDEHPENTVIAELQKGYKLGEKVLRPSLVNVATQI